jgi:hypothetical protein
MKIALKTLQQQAFEVEIDANLTVRHFHSLLCFSRHFFLFWFSSLSAVSFSRFFFISFAA